MNNIADDVRTRIASALPNVLAKAIKDYEKFLEPKEEKETSKTFKERHDACKAALAHIALIVKVSDEICVPGQAGNQQQILEALLTDARKELENQDDSTL
jgi:hypothetical protein